jgi:isopenicillin N synthase-like dioxygenase
MFQRFDFATFQGADGPERELFCQNLVANLQQHGFVKIINHGIPAAVIDDAFETVRDTLLLQPA